MLYCKYAAFFLQLKSQFYSIYAPVTCRHLLIVFGGLSGLEVCLEADESLQLSDPRLLFHHYLNTCPGQGSNTIRTEVIHIIIHNYVLYYQYSK